MATKIKGDKIKENSIPLSALSEEVKNNMGGADWNAHEGEAGYVNNRTHYLDYKFSDTLGKGVTKIPYLYTTAAYFDNTIIEMPPFEDGLEISIVTGPPIYLKYIYEDDNTFIELIDNYSYFENKVIEFYQNVKQIESAYIPNTVIKTTPQTLSDDAKAQALTNLGIDLIDYYKNAKITIDFSKPGRYTFEEYGIDLNKSNSLLLAAIIQNLNGESELESVIVETINVPEYDSDYSNNQGVTYIDHSYTRYLEDDENIFGYIINLSSKIINIYGF